MRLRTLAIAGVMASALTPLTSGFAAAAPAAEIPGDGQYLVGVDIQPGYYEASGVEDPAVACFWRRLWKVQTDTDYNDPNYYIIASDFTRVRPVRVEIKATDVAFRSDNCGSWRMVPTPPSTGSFG
ncbi:hypothetical protein [Nocardia sp. CC227C]|uniref:hypothetical protein n=1 Tax=Nocardia sp. CC227C TaxID=3044562 RepID=UPI00278C6F34|nr:hypothetical protein [Nocardia sp. CC227C]